MFSGIIEERGTVRAISGDHLIIEAQTAREESELGASVAVNGVCLTVVARPVGTLEFDLSQETMARTSLQQLHAGDPVNLERPVTLSTRLGGHIVQGHVDGVGTLVSKEPNEDGGATLVLQLPTRLMRYIVEKGSITVDGISLTVAALTEDTCSVALIPHTLKATTLGVAAPRDQVNLEVDVLAKYVESLMQNGEKS